MAEEFAFDRNADAMDILAAVADGPGAFYGANVRGEGVNYLRANFGGGGRAGYIQGSRRVRPTIERAFRGPYASRNKLPNLS